MGAVIWLHEDALRPDHPVFNIAGPGAKAIFIWDAEDLQSRGHSFKKLVFIYECLEDMGAEIIQGRTEEILSTYCETGDRLYFAETQNPDLLNLIAPLQRRYNVTMVARPRLGNFEVKPEMKRFFRYWNKARTSILKK
jgi:hypothetical protein